MYKGEICKKWIHNVFFTCHWGDQMRWAGHVAYRGNEKWIQSLDQGKRKLGRFRYRWEDIKMDLN